MARPYIELYINNQLIEFEEPPKVLMTYAHTELHNPTIVRNSYSKTLTINGTPNNNKVFNCFYDNNWVVGAGYNPSQKMEFVLYRNGEPMETGYVKLDSVKKNGQQIEYSVTLYGGLGQFLYNLSYKETGDPMKLSDLDYGYDLNMKVNKDTIADAWRHITKVQNTNSLYDFINFAPCYNGIPKDFSANKVAIDVESFKNADDDDLYNQFITEKDGYTTVNGWLMAELEQNYDEWQTKDLRSYLQRPVVRMKSIIEACCNPENNGGFTVELDESFFNDSNEYWDKAWLTLPLLTEIEEVVEGDDGNDFDVTVGETITITGIEKDTDFNVSFNIAVGCNASSSASYLQTCYVNSLWDGSDESAVVDEMTNFARYIQVVAYNANNEIIGGSNAMSFYTPTYGDKFDFELDYKTSLESVTGTYHKQNDGTYRFNNKFYKFTVKNVTYEEGMYFKIVEKFAYTSSPTMSYPSEYKLFTESYASVNVTQYLNDVANDVEVEFIKGLNWFISKDTLLNSEHTPCDYFLSYLKMFNLHIWKDMYENKIYITTRGNYFTNQYYDLEDKIDRGSDMEITPLTFDAKWYNFQTEYNQNGVLYKDYKNEFGIEYGIQKINTNYNFDNSSKDLLENTVFQGCIMQRGKSKYYTDIRHSSSNGAFDYPSYCLDGFKTYLYNGSGDTTEGSVITPKTSEQSTDWWLQKNYDIMPKPSFVDVKNEPIEGANCLLFYNGRQLIDNVSGGTIGFYLTDDIPEFAELNEGEPCWIWSYDYNVARNWGIGGAPDYGDTYLPNFSRYIVNENNWITKSWDFGTPKTLYITDYNIDESSSIYYQYWKPYISDLYSVNTRTLTTKVLLNERVIGDWLMRFYYFDGTYWILNEITDYDPTSNDTTKCTFVRINDTNNYL